MLQHARTIVEAGWVQNRWTVPAAVLGGRRRRRAGRAVRACLVGAVALAVRARDPRADLAVGTGPALAYVWDAVFGSDRSGHDAVHPALRAGRPPRAGSGTGRGPVGPAPRPRAAHARAGPLERRARADPRRRRRGTRQGRGPGGCAGRGARAGLSPYCADGDRRRAP